MNNLFQSQLAKIVTESLRQDRLNGIEKILEVLSDAVGACGCILWESEPFSNLQSEPPTGNLYVFAKWFRSQNIPLYKIPIHASANGYAIVNSGKPDSETLMADGVLSIRNAKDPDAPTHKENYLVKKLDVTSMCVVPICFDCGEGNINASLAVYRNKEIREFSAEEEAFVKTVAHLIPKLYEAICDKVGKKLLKDTNEILDKIETNTKREDGTELSIEEQIETIKPSLNEICEVIAEGFQCFEASLFFENRFEITTESSFKQKNNRKVESVFKLFSTNFREWATEKPEYFLKKSEGLTAWAIVEKASIRIFNLSTFHDDKKKGLYEKEYEGVEWSDSLRFSSNEFKKRLRGMLDLVKVSEFSADEDLPPLSFMAVPILRQGELLGVIRCCAAKNNPWIFPNRHLKVLERVAILISRFWRDFIIHLEEVNETRSWEKLIQKINSQNKKVQGKIDRFDFSEDELFKDILKITSDAFSDIDILDIRLLDKETGELFFRKTRGAAWESGGTKTEREDRLNKRFSKNNKNSKKIFAFDVIETGNVKFISDVKKESDYWFETFPQTQQIIIAPIGVANRNIGVLDIRRTTDDTFASNATIMAELIGRQLGLYLELIETEKQQRQVFEDTWHQLKSPVRHTFARATALLDHKSFEKEPYIIDNKTANEIVSELLMLRGVARKAHKVLVNAGIFTELATKGELKQVKDTTLLTFRDFRKMLSEIVNDTRLMLEEYRDINFHRGLETFEQLDKLKIKVKFDYLEQAINCLVDNAGKYSYTDSLVRIYGREEVLENRKWFAIAVENEGLEIDSSEIETLKQRKVRGKRAQLTTGEGSGIGLWITDHIMRAHMGKLIILPTNLKGLTTVKLLFPIPS